MSLEAVRAIKTATTARPVPAPARRGLLQRTCACGGLAGPTGECAACRRSRVLGRPLQAKLRISRPGDAFEQEADRVADQVMRMPEPGLQRQVGEKEEEEKEEDILQTRPLIQRRVTGDAGGGVAPPIVHDVLRSPGQPLEPSTRRFMEARFGHDFRNVRIHTDALAAQSAQAIGAHAYTVGSHIVFSRGRYQVDTVTGKNLLAHELTHVIQQRNGQRFIQRQTPNSPRPAANKSTSQSVATQLQKIAATIKSVNPTSLSPVDQKLLELLSSHSVSSLREGISNLTNARAKTLMQIRLNYLSPYYYQAMNAPLIYNPWAACNITSLAMALGGLGIKNSDFTGHKDQIECIFWYLKDRIQHVTTNLRSIRTLKKLRSGWKHKHLMYAVKRLRILMGSLLNKIKISTGHRRKLGAILKKLKQRKFLHKFLQKVLLQTRQIRHDLQKKVRHLGITPWWLLELINVFFAVISSLNLLLPLLGQTQIRCKPGETVNCKKLLARITSLILYEIDYDKNFALFGSSTTTSKQSNASSPIKCPTNRTGFSPIATSLRMPDFLQLVAVYVAAPSGNCHQKQIASRVPELWSQPAGGSNPPLILRKIRKIRVRRCLSHWQFLNLLAGQFPIPQWLTRRSKTGSASRSTLTLSLISTSAPGIGCKIKSFKAWTKKNGINAQIKDLCTRCNRDSQKPCKYKVRDAVKQAGISGSVSSCENKAKSIKQNYLTKGYQVIILRAISDNVMGASIFNKKGLKAGYHKSMTGHRRCDTEHLRVHGKNLTGHFLHLIDVDDKGIIVNDPGRASGAARHVNWTLVNEAGYFYKIFVLK